MNNETILTLSLNLEDINKILGHIGKAPYQEVFEVINKITQQASQQIQIQESKQPLPTAE